MNSYQNVLANQLHYLSKNVLFIKGELSQASRQQGSVLLTNFKVALVATEC